MAMTGASAFIVIQLLLLVIMLHALTDKIQKKVDKGENEFIWYKGKSLSRFNYCSKATATIYTIIPSLEKPPPGF